MSPIPEADSVPSPDEPTLQSDEEPIPLTPQIRIPKFPVDQLPKWLADMVGAVSVATQTDPSMAATSALGAISACTGGHAEVEVRSGWRELLVLYLATIAESGERKSPVQHAMAAPIFEVEKQLIEKGKADRIEALAQREIAEKTAKRAYQVAANADDDKHDDALEEAVNAAMLADSINVPAIPRIIADDITPEAAAALLADQGGRLAIISDEGGIFDIIAGRYSNAPNMDVYLKGHWGGPLRVDRKSSAPQMVDRPALTVALMIQQDVLHTIATMHQFRGRGLLARFLYSYPVSKFGSRKPEPPPVDPAIEHEYRKRAMELASGLAEWTYPNCAMLTLTPQAQKAIVMITAQLEPTLAGGGELDTLRDWGGKYVGAIARIAGMLHLAELGPENGPFQSVTAETILAAARIGAYFKACAIKAFGEMKADPATADAVYLLERIKQLGQSEVSERDLLRAAKRFRKKEDLLPALKRLASDGYLTLLEQPKSTGGRPASQGYRVHPNVIPLVTKGQK